jgi:hypothetical protein
MARVFTSSFVQNLQSNLSTSLATNINHSTLFIDPKIVQQHYFQLLIFNEASDNPPQLVYGTLENLREKYHINPEDFLSPDKEFKTVDPNFCPLNIENVHEWSSIYLLFQARKLSRMIAHTWLNHQKDNLTKKRVDLVKEILRLPTLKYEIYWLGEPNKKPEKINETKLVRNLSEEEDKKLTSWLIKPEHINYDKIALALLLCGQAYYKDGNDKLRQIWTPIASIYELIYLYGIEVSWDTFYGVIEEISNIGGKQKFPANQIKIPYPPRPSEFNLSQADIETWAEAKYHYHPHDLHAQYSFYPARDTEDWKNKKLNCVYPPFPYIPLSTL